MQLGNWMADLRHALRALRRTPGFTLTAVGMLGLAIGAVAGMFNVVNTVLLDRLPYAHPDRLVYITASAPGSGLPDELGGAPEFFLQYQEQSTLLEDIALYNNYTATLRVGDRVERVRMSSPSNSLYSTLGVQPILGRLPTEQDEDRAVVISHALWTTWFGQDPSVIGRTYDIAEGRRTVIGVMGKDFRFPRNDTMLWISSTIRPADIKTPGRFGTNLVGRMAAGATLARVANELTTLAARLPERFGGPPAYARLIAQHRAVVRMLDDELLGDYAGPLWVLFAAACLVLLIACANVANLFLVRIEGRHQEMAVRRAIGAARGQLVRLHMAEAVVVAALAAGVAALLAVAALPVFLAAAPGRIPRLDEVHFGFPALLFTVAAAAISAFLCAGPPALRGASPDLARLREGGRGSTRKRHWLRHGLVVGQTALALALLIGSGLLMRSAYELHQVHPGYDTKDILTFQIAPERPELKDAPSFARFNLAFLDRLAALPGVQAVGLVENVPINESTSVMPVRTERMSADTNEGQLVHYNYTAGDYFKAMGIRLLAGRGFSADDHGVARGNVVVSKSAAATLWPGLDPIGQRLQRRDQTAWETVVGMVDDVMQDDLQAPAEAAIYFPMVDTTEQGGRAVSSPAYVVRSARAEDIAPEVRALVHEVAPEAPMYRVFTMAYLIEDSMLQLSFTLLTLGIVSLLALILGAVGLYAVLSYVVDERTREIGVRMALGARAAQVRAMVVGQGVCVVGVGVAIGVLVALAGTRALASLLFGVQPLDVATFVAMPLVMVLVGLLASYLPARRASNLDPIESLRRD
ncbi:ABC transporter permease [Dokdonella sp.]|uniref:ABC transporter permease n=1 Tax=Dokdonella sp. TaxID=2291710 RepID=UPI001AFE9B32|nr:ABC transporter permease [Dokdonella sp.]MBO9664096.1 ABC transporter permease [Dokdonella sp.]